MKKTILLSLGLLFIFLSNAQISKGKVLLGGNFYGGNHKYESDAATLNELDAGYFSLSVGKAIDQNLIAGVSGYYNSEKHLDLTGNYNRVNRYGSSLFLRRYMPIGKKFYIIGEGSLNFNSSKLKNHSTAGIHYSTNSKSIAISLSPSIAYELTKKLQLETGLSSLATIRYYWQENRSDDFITDKSKGLDINASGTSAALFHVGFRIYL